MKLIRTVLSSTVAALAIIALPAQAGRPAPQPEPSCGSWASAAVAYNACTGFTSGNNSLADANLQGFGTFSYGFKDNNLAQGISDTPVFDLYGSAASLTLVFNESVVGEFLVSLKLGNHAAYYDFDGAGIHAGQTLTFTSHLTGYQGLGLSHVSVYSTEAAVPGVPEPETYALMLAGLGVVGVMARRGAKRA